MKADNLRWIVLVGDDEEVVVTIPDIEYQSEDHIGEVIAEETGKLGYDPDLVEDCWPDES